MSGIAAITEYMFLAGAVCLLVAGGTACGDGSVPPWPGKESGFHGFRQFDFVQEGLQCKIVLPVSPASGLPWVWRARFFGAEPQTDIALLKKGFHIAYVDVEGLFGSPAAVERWDRFYSFMVKEKKFSAKPVIEAFSRGGLIAYNWASRNPEKVACIYADAPVCDIKSWPLGSGTGEGWQEGIAPCLEAYGLTREEAPAFRGNPIDNLESLAKAGVPLLHVAGDDDVVVPVAENTAVIEKRYRELGGSIEVIHKPGIGHHPHSLPDPEPIVRFILKHTDY